jgi:hypothetical protein
MRRTPLQVGAAALVALFVAGGISWLYAAMYVETVGEAPSALSAPIWLGPFSEFARLSCYLVPGAALGVLARWRPGSLGFVLGFLVSYVLVLDARWDVVFSSWQLGLALSSGLLWAAGAMSGGYLVTRWTPNKSLERTRER